VEIQLFKSHLLSCFYILTVDSCKDMMNHESWIMNHESWNENRESNEVLSDKISSPGILSDWKDRNHQLFGFYRELRNG
jgi:hypothetical protein